MILSTQFRLVNEDQARNLVNDGKGICYTGESVLKQRHDSFILAHILCMFYNVSDSDI